MHLECKELLWVGVAAGKLMGFQVPGISSSSSVLISILVRLPHFRQLLILVKKLICGFKTGDQQLNQSRFILPELELRS